MSKLSPKYSKCVVMMLHYTLIRVRPSSVFSRLFPSWSENCVSTLVTAVLFSSWPWLMYCFHYLLMYLGCSLCSVLILWRCLSICLASLQVWGLSMWMSCVSSYWSVASEESKTPSIWWRFFQVCCDFIHCVILLNSFHCACYEMHVYNMKWRRDQHSDPTRYWN